MDIFYLFYASLFSLIAVSKQTPNCTCVTKEELLGLRDRLVALDKLMESVDREAAKKYDNATEGSSISRELNLNQTSLRPTSPGENLDKQNTDGAPFNGSTSSWSAKSENAQNFTDGMSSDKNNIAPGRSPNDFLTQRRQLLKKINETLDSQNHDSSQLPSSQDQVIALTEEACDNLVSDVVSSGTEIKLNHTLILATYTMLQRLNEKIKQLNSTVNEMLENAYVNGMRTSSSTYGGHTEKIKVSEIVKKLTHLEGIVDALQQKTLRDPPSKPICEGQRKHVMGTSCYMVPRRRQGELLFTWWDSRFWCKENLGPNADLVTIESPGKFENISRLLRNHFGDIEEYWLGGNDLTQEGEWTWTAKGTQLTYTNWENGVPPNDISKNCMSMRGDHTWAAEPCYFDRYPLCELTLA